MSKLAAVLSDPLQCTLLNPYQTLARWTYVVDHCSIPRLYVSYSEIYQRTSLEVATVCCNADTYMSETGYSPHYACVECKRESDRPVPGISFYAELKPWLNGLIRGELGLNMLEHEVLLGALKDRIDVLVSDLETLVDRARSDPSNLATLLPTKLTRAAKRESRPLNS